MEFYRTSDKFKKLKDELEKERERIDDKLDTIAILSAMEPLADLSNAEKSEFTLADLHELHSKKSFENFINSLPTNLYLRGFGHGGNEHEEFYHNIYQFMTDDYTTINIDFVEIHKKGAAAPTRFELWVHGFKGAEKLQLDVKPPYDDSDNEVYINIVAPDKKGFAVFDFWSPDNSVTEYDTGKLVTEVIGTTDFSAISLDDDFSIQYISNSDVDETIHKR